MTPAVSTSAFGPLRRFVCSRPRSVQERCGVVPCSVHVPRAGSPCARFGSIPSGPPPLLHSTRHPTTPLWVPARQLSTVEGNRGCLPRMPGDWRSEVKEEGRIGRAGIAWAVTRPGGHERSRSPGSVGSRGPMQAGICLRATATGRKRSFVSGRSFYALRVARSAVGPLT